MEKIKKMFSQNYDEIPDSPKKNSEKTLEPSRGKKIVIFNNCNFNYKENSAL